MLSSLLKIFLNFFLTTSSFSYQTFDFSPFLISEKNYNEVLSKSRRKNFKSLDADQKILEFGVWQKEVLRVSKELLSFYGNFLSNEYFGEKKLSIIENKNTILAIYEPYNENKFKPQKVLI